MRTVVWVVLLFVGAVVAASTLGANDGLVTFYWRGWRLDVSLNLFVVGLLVTCFVLASAFQAVHALVSLPVRAHEWRVEQRRRAAEKALREALAEYLAARYTRSQKAAQRALSIQENTHELRGDHDLRVLAHLLAAASAHRLQDRVRRDDHLSQLRKASRRPGVTRAAEEGARLMAAEWALDDRDASRALGLLSDLAPGVARRTHALRLRLQAARLARQPLDALRTARLLAKHQAFSAAAAQGLLRSLAGEAIDGAHDIDQLRRVWQQLEAPDRRDPFVAARVAQRACRLGAHEEARNWLRPSWERLGELPADERECLALALAENVAGVGVDWLPRLESAQRTFPTDSAVALAAGLAFAERQLWGKARRPLEQAAAAADLKATERRVAWRRLADLARQDADDARATACEQAAAQVE
jgi:HemY protein